MRGFLDWLRAVPPEPPPDGGAAAADELALDEIKVEAGMARDEAEAAVRRWAPEIARRTRVAEAIKDGERRRITAGGQP